jgi:hypothetical protein
VLITPLKLQCFLIAAAAKAQADLNREYGADSFDAFLSDPTAGTNGLHFPAGSDRSGSQRSFGFGSGHHSDAAPEQQQASAEEAIASRAVQFARAANAASAAAQVSFVVR